MCTINDSHMMYGSWDMECNRQNFLSFWTVFLLFYPTNNQKNKIFEKKEKTAWRYYNFTHVYHKWHSYDVWFLRYWARRIELFVILDQFLLFYPPNNTKNQNFEKLKKTHGEIIILHKCTKNHNHMLYCSLHMAHNRCNYFSFWAISYPFTSLTAQKIKI